MSTRPSRRPRKPRGSRSSRPIPSGHGTADQPWPSKVFGAGRAQRLSSVARFEASRLARSASRQPARHPACFGVPGRDRPSRTAPVSEQDRQAPATLRASSSLAAIGDRPLQEAAADREVGPARGRRPARGHAPGEGVDGGVAGDALLALP